MQIVETPTTYNKTNIWKKAILGRIAVPLLLVAAIQAGCFSSYKIDAAGSGLHPKFSQDDRIYIVVPRDGKYGATTYSGSGVTVARVLLSAFSRFASKVQLGLRFEELESALLSARDGDSKYLVLPTILRWEDRATAWSGRRDRLQLRIDIIDVDLGSTVHSTFIEGQSGSFIWHSPSPEDLLEEPILEYVASQY